MRDFYDHGLERHVSPSYGKVRPKDGVFAERCSFAYVWETGSLFLKTREVLETDGKIVIHGFRSIC